MECSINNQNIIEKVITTITGQCDYWTLTLLILGIVILSIYLIKKKKYGLIFLILLLSFIFMLGGIGSSIV